ncbi:hypothetical protein GCM10010302_39120 [Streptomyces polychromogenes]|uniref:Uncharacterized protein n=1 Tax=Streptomyces polychromogenes TaxID=67342 RepID=A0ABN0VFK7_9ACTN
MFAVVAGVLGLALAFAPAGPGQAAADRDRAPRAQAAQAASAQAGRTVSAQAGPGVRAVLVEAAPARGPVCAPDSGGPAPAPAVPPRAGQEHGSVPVARTVPEGVRPYRAECVRVPVRGPDQRAPGPVELSVLRV